MVAGAEIGLVDCCVARAACCVTDIIFAIWLSLGWRRQSSIANSKSLAVRTVDPGSDERRTAML